MYKILAIIYRVINDKWILILPKQPKKGIAFHNNDSYRELALTIKNKDVNMNIKKLIYPNKPVSERNSKCI